MYIETTRMLIRDFIPEDVYDLHEILGDDETMKGCEAAYELEKTRAFLSSFCIERKAAAAAVHKESGKLIGYILFNEITEGEYEIGWFFNRGFWRQGFAYESCRAVIDYAFCRLNAKKMFAETVDTVRSVGLMKKLGMQLEGIEPSGIPDTPMYIYSLLEGYKEHKHNLVRIF